VTSEMHSLLSLALEADLDLDTSWWHTSSKAAATRLRNATAAVKELLASNASLQGKLQKALASKRQILFGKEAASGPEHRTLPRRQQADGHDAASTVAPTGTHHHLGATGGVTGLDSNLDASAQHAAGTGSPDQVSPQHCLGCHKMQRECDRSDAAVQHACEALKQMQAEIDCLLVSQDQKSSQLESCRTCQAAFCSASPSRDAHGPATRLGREVQHVGTRQLRQGQPQAPVVQPCAQSLIPTPGRGGRHRAS
jgi:hypothetical protein